MRIALLGTRGIPANYGGFETFAEELSVRLVERGHSVTVYCRQRHSSPNYKGVRLRYIPTVRHKYFDTIAHTAISTLHLLFHRFDAVLYCNAANALFTLLPRPLLMPTILNVDGLERHRKKWNWIAKSWYRISEWLATWCPTAVVSDAERIREYYLEHYKKQSTFIPYGAPVGKVPETDALREFGLTSGGYVLYVSRMEPENNALLVRETFEQIRSDLKLVMVGDAPYAADYIAAVRQTDDPRVIFPGAIYGDRYHQLQSHSAVYVQATEVGGTHPAMIEAMGRGALVLYLQTPESDEVAGEAAVPFKTDLKEKLQWAVDLPAEERTPWGARGIERVTNHYGWDAVTDQYERLFHQIAAKK